MSDPTRTSTHTAITVAIRTTRKGRCTVCGRKCQQTHGFSVDTTAARAEADVFSLQGLMDRWESENPYITCSRCLP